MTTTNDDMSTDMALRPVAALPTFAVLDHAPAALRELVRQALGSAMALQDLDRIKMPSGAA